MKEHSMTDNSSVKPKVTTNTRPKALSDKENDLLVEQWKNKQRKLCHQTLVARLNSKQK